MIIGLADAGRALRSKAGAVPEQVFCASACSLEELRQLKQELEKLRTSLGAA